MVIFRKLVTPDGTELISHNLHDYISYTDKNGKFYMLDGGNTGYYFRASINGDEKFVEISTSSPFKDIRENFERYNRYTKTYVKLKDMSDSWLQNVIDWFINKELTTNPIFLIFIEEKVFRAENELFVTEDKHYQLDYAG